MLYACYTCYLATLSVSSSKEVASCVRSSCFYHFCYVQSPPFLMNILTTSWNISWLPSRVSCMISMSSMVDAEITFPKEQSPFSEESSFKMGCFKQIIMVVPFFETSIVMFHDVSKKKQCFPCRSMQTSHVPSKNSTAFFGEGQKGALSREIFWVMGCNGTSRRAAVLLARNSKSSIVEAPGSQIGRLRDPKKFVWWRPLTGDATVTIVIKLGAVVWTNDDSMLSSWWFYVIFAAIEP